MRILANRIYYVINIIDKVVAGPYTLREAMREQDSQENFSVITKIVIDEDGKGVN